MKNTRGMFRNIHPNFPVGGRGDGDDNTKATLRNVKVFVMRVTHAPLYHSARCIFSWTVLPGTEGGGGVKNAWRTSPAAQHQDFRNRLLSCYRSLLFLPRSVRDTFLPCEIHTSSTSIRRGRGGWARAWVDWPKSSLPRLSLLPYIPPSSWISFVSSRRVLVFFNASIVTILA